MTIHCTTEMTLEHPAAEAWSVLADYARDPEWRGGVRSMVPTPAGLVTVGTTTVEDMRFAGRSMRNVGEIVSVEPGRTFTWRTTEGADAHGSRTVEPLGSDRCTVRLELVIEPKPSERVMVPVVRRMMQRQLDADLRSLAELLDAGDGASVAPGVAAGVA